MGKHSFFVIYRDDEGGATIDKYSEEAPMVKGIAKEFEASKKVPALVIRGEALKVSVSTKVLIEMQEPK